MVPQMGTPSEEFWAEQKQTAGQLRNGGTQVMGAWPSKKPGLMLHMSRDWDTGTEGECR